MATFHVTIEQVEAALDSGEELTGDIAAAVEHVYDAAVAMKASHIMFYTARHGELFDLVVPMESPLAGGRNVHKYLETIGARLGRSSFFRVEAGKFNPEVAKFFVEQSAIETLNTITVKVVEAILQNKVNPYISLHVPPRTSTYLHVPPHTSNNLQIPPNTSNNLQIPPNTSNNLQ